MWLIYFRTTHSISSSILVPNQDWMEIHGSPNGRKIHKKFLKTVEEVSEFKLSLNGCGTSSLLVVFLFASQTVSSAQKCLLAKLFQFFDG